MAAPLVAIITVAYDSERCIGALLSSLAADRESGVRTRVYVIDNASADKTRDVVRKAKPRVTLIENSANAGYGAANNRAASVAIEDGAEYLAFVNPDARVSPGWLTPIVARLAARPDLACVQPRIMLAADPDRANSLGNRIHFLGFGFTAGYGERYEPGAALAPCSYASGCACVFRAADFAAAGGFDPGFFLYHEDQDLGWRLRQAGKAIEVEAESVVYHDYRYDGGGSKFYFLERNRWAFLLIHYRLRTLLLVLPALVAMEIGLLFFCLVSGTLPDKTRAVRSLCSAGTRSWIASRRRIVQEARTRSDRDLVRHLAPRLAFGPIGSALFRRVVDPLLGLYWRVVRPFV